MGWEGRDTLTGRWRWRSCGTWLSGTSHSRCRSGKGRTRGAGHGGRCLAGPAPLPGWPGGPACPGRGGHSPGQSCEGRRDEAGTGRVAWGPQPTGAGARPGGCHQVCQALRATVPLSPAHPGSVAPAVTPATAQSGPTGSFTPVLRIGTTQCTRTPSAPCQHSGVWDWGHRPAKAGCPMSPRWDRTPCPKAPGSRDPRNGWPLPAPSPPCPQHHDPQLSQVLESPKTSINPGSGHCVPRRGTASLPRHRARGRRRTENAGKTKP